MCLALKNLRFNYHTGVGAERSRLLKLKNLSALLCATEFQLLGQEWSYKEQGGMHTCVHTHIHIHINYSLEEKAQKSIGRCGPMDKVPAEQA